MSENTVAVEIAVQDAAGARAAMAAGATRLELCQALGVGGLTPSLGLLEAVLDAVDPAAVNVLVRPRGGGFVYDADEIAVVDSDIRACVARGVGGVVVGALDTDGLLDVDVLRRWQDAAGGATVVFHRAIDASADPDAVLDALLALDVPRVLTSAGAPVARDGATALAGFARRAGGRIEIMAGGGVLPADVPALRATGVGAVHLSARTQVGGDQPSGPGGGADGHDATDAAVVAAAVSAARA